MSNRYKGGVISATPPTTTGGEDGTASGAWTLEQQMQLQAAGLWPAQPTGPYIEQVFSTYLYTGNGSTQTITNGIDLSGKGGLVWIKSRSNAEFHRIFDTARGVNKSLSSNSTNAQNTAVNTVTAFNTTGFNLGNDSDGNGTNTNAYTYASWTFRKQPKFFDVVTYTGNGGTPQNISHSLGSVPGFIVVKPTSTTGSWICYHRSLTASGFNPAPYNTINLNSTGSILEDTGAWNSTAPTSTVFTIGSSPDVNTNGASYVAYLFAHDAGGFGTSGSENVISCGSYTGTGALLNVSLGYEPQWILARASSTTANWRIFDNMRGWPAPSGQDAGALFPNLSNAETANGDLIYPTSTGFQLSTNGTLNTSGATYIYIAIRRGPMAVPTSGTSVYNAVSRTGTGTAATITGIGFAPDLLDNQRTTAGSYTGFFDRLRGGGKLLYRALDDAETTVTGQTTQFNTTMDGFAVGTSTASDSGNNNTVPYIWHCFKRAPSFFDEVCYTGNGSTQNVSHNLGVAPELMIVKSRSLSGSDWWVYASPLTTPQNKYLRLQSTDGESTVSGLWGSSLPTSTTFGLGAFAPNSNGATFVAYLFATCAGVSKVGSYTGTGALQTVNCGFAAGARFILIKRTDSTGDWYVYDSTRGITSGNDPYLLWNTTGAEVTGTDYINTASVGFQVTATAPAGLNASGGTYIFLAIA